MGGLHSQFDLLTQFAILLIDNGLVGLRLGNLGGGFATIEKSHPNHDSGNPTIPAIGLGKTFVMPAGGKRRHGRLALRLGDFDSGVGLFGSLSERFQLRSIRAGNEFAWPFDRAPMSRNYERLVILQAQQGLQNCSRDCALIFGGHQIGFCLSHLSFQIQHRRLQGLASLDQFGGQIEISLMALQ